MRILLIYPPITAQEPIKIEPHPPLGLAYLAAFLEKHNHQVKILDALVLGLTDNQICQRIKKYRPELVGISQMFTNYAADGYRLAEITKKINPKITVVIGGAHPSINPESIFKNKNIDFVVKGEGEIAFLKLIQDLAKKTKNLKKIYSAPFIKNLDTLPFPAWHLLPMKTYDRPDDPLVRRHPLFSMITSRGCPGKCVFCSIHAIWGHCWRGRSPKNVVDEIELLLQKYGIREIHFQDDSLSVNPVRLKEICQEIIRRRLNFKWATPNGIAYWTLNPELLGLMKQAGCYRITFGIESASWRMRRWIGKPYSLSLAKKLTQTANQLGFWTIHTYILGFPYETKKQIQKTIDFALNSGVDFALFYRLAPRLGTPVYDIFKQEGWLKSDNNLEGVPTQTKYFSPAELIAIRNSAYRRFLSHQVIRFLNPAIIGQKIKNREDLNYALRLVIYGLKLIPKLFLQPKQKITSKVIKGTF